jgi:hypothetical protein
LLRDALGGQLRWNSSWLGVFALIHPLGWLRLEAEFWVVFSVLLGIFDLLLRC